MSSVCSLEPQCSLGLIFQKHQQIRKESCPEIAIWMNVTFVDQRQKLGELMGLRPTAQLASCILHLASCSLDSQTMYTRVEEERLPGWKTPAGWAALSKVRRELGREEASLTHRNLLLCNKLAVVFLHPLKSVTRVRDEESHSQNGGMHPSTENTKLRNRIGVNPIWPMWNS